MCVWCVSRDRQTDRNREKETQRETHQEVGILSCFNPVRLFVTVCMDHSPPGSSVHGILQARILEWAVIPFSRGSS